jgi:glutathione peroxidase
MTTVYDFHAVTLAGEDISLGGFAGHVLLVVNTASKCGFTQQYDGLESLYRTYRDRGFKVLGFPCNQFGGQEPGSAEEIGAFCETSFGVTFPLFQRVDVNGPGAHPLYRFLAQEKRGLLGTKSIKWNFTKFLIDRTGRVVARYSPRVKPAAIEGAIQNSLKCKQHEVANHRQQRARQPQPPLRSGAGTDLSQQSEGRLLDCQVQSMGGSR